MSEIERIAPRALGMRWNRIHDPACSNAPCDCITRRALTYERLATVLGDCVSCDGYILDASEAPYCHTCSRLRREAESSTSR